MSFSSDVKNEIMSLFVKSKCCRHAMLRGLMLAADGGDVVSFPTESKAVCDFTSRLISELLGITPDISEQFFVGRTRYVLSFKSPKISDFIQRCDNGEPFGEISDFRCQNCSHNFVRGAFLALGSITDPEKGTHIEFLVPSEHRANLLDELLAELGHSPRRVTRKKKVGLYYKSSASVEELLAEMGVNSSVFKLMNVKIEKEIRNNENRATNCVAKNISKAVNASFAQVSAIIRLKDCGVFDTLSDDLRVTAELRLENSEATMSELAALHLPPISKSGVSHRLARIIEIAEKSERASDVD